MSKGALYTIYTVLALSIVACVGSFIINFSGHSVSGESEHWGQLGDYVGGLMNPIIAIINVFVAIQIAKGVNSFSEQQTKRQVEAQKEIVRAQFLYEILKDLKAEILGAYNQIEQSLRTNNHLQFDEGVAKAHSIIDGFIKYHQEMFSFPPGIALSIVTEYNKWIAYRTQGQFNAQQLLNAATKNKLEIDLMLSLLYGSIIEAAKKPEAKPITKEIMDEWERKLGLKPEQKSK